MTSEKKETSIKNNKEKMFFIQITNQKKKNSLQK